MIRTVYLSLLAFVCAAQSAAAYNQAFVTREMKGGAAAHMTREIGGKNHVAPDEVERAGVFTYSSPAAGPAMMTLPKPKTKQVIVDGYYVKVGSKFDMQITEITPTQKPAWAVTPEQHGAALGWSGKHISGGKEFPVGY